jgi:hypothetical protein
MQMLKKSGMCPSTVLGSTTTAAVKGNDVVLTITSDDHDAIAAIQTRADELVKARANPGPGAAHDQKSHGTGMGLCPVFYGDGGTATASHDAKGVTITITPKLKADALKATIDKRIVAAADWVKANIKPGDAGNMGAVGGANGEHGANHSGKGDGKGKQMAKRMGNCPSTVLGATTKDELKGKAVLVMITADGKNAIAGIQKRTSRLLAEKRETTTTAHDQKGTHGGHMGECPVFLGDGSVATSKQDAKGVTITITPKDKPEELKSTIDNRIARTAEWVKANVKPGETGSTGGVGGGKGDHGTNHSGHGDGKGKTRKG